MKKKNREREEKRTVGPFVHTERERDIGRDRHSVDIYGAHRSARSSFGKGQMAAVVSRGQTEGGLRTWDVGFNFQFVIFFSFFLFFHCWRVGHVRVVLASCRRSEKKKKETLLGHQSSASHTSSGVRHVTNTNTLPKLACRCNLLIYWEVTTIDWAKTGEERGIKDGNSKWFYFIFYQIIINELMMCKLCLIHHVKLYLKMSHQLTRCHVIVH